MSGEDPAHDEGPDEEEVGEPDRAVGDFGDAEQSDRGGDSDADVSSGG